VRGGRGLSAGALGAALRGGLLSLGGVLYKLGDSELTVTPTALVMHGVRYELVTSANYVHEC